MMMSGMIFSCDCCGRTFFSPGDQAELTLHRMFFHYEIKCEDRVSLYLCDDCNTRAVRRLKEFIKSIYNPKDAVIDGLAEVSFTNDKEEQK